MTDIRKQMDHRKGIIYINENQTGVLSIAGSIRDFLIMRITMEYGRNKYSFNVEGSVDFKHEQGAHETTFDVPEHVAKLFKNAQEVSVYLIFI